MIFWKDFILDDKVGPLLVATTSAMPINVSRRRKQIAAQSCREMRFGSPSVMEDALGTNGTLDGVSIQETRREQRPARMVGPGDLDFAQADMEVSRSNRTRILRQRGEE